jgi:hypothetical protein
MSIGLRKCPLGGANSHIGFHRYRRFNGLAKLGLHGAAAVHAAVALDLVNDPTALSAACDSLVARQVVRAVWRQLGNYRQIVRHFRNS